MHAIDYLAIQKYSMRFFRSLFLSSYPEIVIFCWMSFFFAEILTIAFWIFASGTDAMRWIAICVQYNDLLASNSNKYKHNINVVISIQHPNLNANHPYFSITQRLVESLFRFDLVTCSEPTLNSYTCVCKWRQDYEPFALTAKKSLELNMSWACSSLSTFLLERYDARDHFTSHTHISICEWNVKFPNENSRHHETSEMLLNFSHKIESRSRNADRFSFQQHSFK